MTATRPLWIGTYPAAGAGTPIGLGEGVWRVDLDVRTGTLGTPAQVVALPSPSFLALRDGTLYAALEAEQGAVATLTVDGDRLVERTTTPSGGAFPCHLLTAVPGVLAVANYGTGTLGVVPLDADGTPVAEPAVHGTTGHGPRTDRQEGPHAHFVALAPGGGHLLVADLGVDRLRRYRLTAAGVEPDGVAATFPPGTGPRHLDFSADGRFAYVVGELDEQVHVLAWDAATATGTPLQTVPAVVGPARPPHSGQGDDPVRHGADPLPSHLEIAGDEVLVAVRGADVLTRYAVGPDGRLADGRSHDLGGHWPRHFAVVDGWVVVALERAHELVVLDAAGAAVSRVPLPSPTCVLPAG